MRYFFSSVYSLNSILTLDSAKAQPDGKADSIFDCVKSGEELYLVEKTPASFMKAFEQCNKLDIKLRYGLRLICCNDISDKNIESAASTEHKVIIFARNGIGYQELSQLYGIAATKGKLDNSKPPRIDQNILAQYWTNNMLLVIPFYDSFLWNNTFLMHNCIVDFDKYNPIFTIEKHNLPFDQYMGKKVRDFCKNRFDIWDTHTVYYKDKNDIMAFQAYKILQNKTTFDKPELEDFGSREFAFNQ